MAQYARLITGLLWFAWGDWMTAAAGGSLVPLLAVLTAASGLAVIALAVVPRSDAAQRSFDLFLLIGTLVIVSLVGVAAGSTRPLGSDEIALDQAAAIQLLHGANPYASDLGFALHQFGVSVGTVTLHGGVVSTASYPSLSFLLYVPAVALFGADSYGPVLVNMACWALAAVVLWRLTAPTARPWLSLFFALPVFFGPVTGGNVDTLSLPFVLIALFSWDRFGDPAERSALRWMGPLALGVACAVKQNPWLLVPFLLIGVGFEARARGESWRNPVARYAAIVGGTFLLLNLPFIVWDPLAWASGVLQPFTGGLIPVGVGPVDLMRSYGIGGGNLVFFAVASGGALLAALALYVARYDALKRLVPLLPLAALLVSSRSLSTYFAFSVPAIAVCAASVKPASAAFAARVARPARAAATVCIAVSVAALMSALIQPAPFRLSVLAVDAAPTSVTLHVRVENTRAEVLTPHFVLAQGRDFRVPLNVLSGPQTLAPSTSALFSLNAGEDTAVLVSGATYQVQVVTDSPATLSVTLVQQVPAQLNAG